jgi:mannose-6-phosphate isomerase-like protein (cupin superfamily)
MKPTRRVTSGIEHKISKIMTDEEIETLVPYPAMTHFKIQDLFYTEENPQSVKTRHLDQPYDISLPCGAMRFMKIRMPTKKEMIADLTAAGQPTPDDWSMYNVHKTDSVDYIYVLSGEITYVVGEEKTQLRAGDFLAQIGPEHTWINDSDEPCYVLCVLVGIAPTGEAKKMVLD